MTNFMTKNWSNIFDRFSNIKGLKLTLIKKIGHKSLTIFIFVKSLGNAGLANLLNKNL